MRQFRRAKKEAYLTALSECNRILIRATQENDLLQEICRIIVERGGYRLAWVGYASHDDFKTVRPAAQYGYEDGYLQSIKISWGENEFGQGPSGTAIRTGQPVIMRDMETGHFYGPWREEAIRRGFHSSMAIPLKIEEQIIGMLAIYSPYKNAFNHQEQQLLTELADNLAYGLQSLRSRQAIQQSEGRYRLMADHSTDMISRHNTDGFYIYASPASLHLTGYSPEELLGHSPYECVHVEDQPGLLGAHQYLVHSKQPVVSTFRVLRKDNHYIWIEATATPVLQNDQIHEIVVVSREITERKEVEKALIENVILFQSLFESASEAIVLVNEEGSILLVNRRLETMFGYERFELIGKSVEVLIPAELREEHKIEREEYALHPHLRIAGTITKDLFGQRKDGSRFLIDVSLSPIKTEDGNMVMALITDITLRKQAEQELRRTNEQLKTVFDNVEQVFFSLDMVNKKILQISSACEKVYGIPPQAFYDNPHLWKEVILPEDMPVVRENHRYLTTGKFVTVICRIMRPNKEVRWIEVKVKPHLDDDGNLTRLDGTVADITERRRAARLAVAGEIATGVAHQINNPLTAVIAETYLLLKKFPPDSPEHESLQFIQEATSRAGNIVQRLLNLARAQVGEMGMIDVNASLNRTIEFLRPQIQPYTARLITVLEENLPSIYGSEEHLQDVWMNLLLNAKEAVEHTDHPMIQITTRHDMIANTVEIQFKDNGHGIDPRHIDHIFDPFFTTKENGAGLGLSLCHDIITNHRGSVRVSNETGTTFTVILPCGRE